MRFEYCCRQRTERGRSATHRRPHLKPSTAVLSRATTHGCAICVDCVRRRGPSADEDGLSSLYVHDVDAYLQQCCRGLRRASIEDCTVCLRDFLRHLHGSGRTATDLSGTVIGPRIYEHEDIPSALRPQELRRVLEVTRKDVFPAGLQDYAILMLLATYGLRAAEIVRMHLDDVDWKRDLLHVRHSKTGRTPNFHYCGSWAKPCSDIWRKRAPKATIEKFSCASTRHIARSNAEQSSAPLRVLD